MIRFQAQASWGFLCWLSSCVTKIVLCVFRPTPAPREAAEGSFLWSLAVQADVSGRPRLCLFYIPVVLLRDSFRKRHTELNNNKCYIGISFVLADILSGKCHMTS